MSRPADLVAAASQVSPADKWVSRAAVATVAALAGLAGASSLEAVWQLLDHGVEHAFFGFLGAGALAGIGA